MELNCIVDGIEMVGTVIKDLSVKNNIVDIGKDARKSFGLNINEPTFEKIENAVIAQVAIHFQIEISISKLPSGEGSGVCYVRAQLLKIKIVTKLNKSHH